jgi:hypothetical protein
MIGTTAAIALGLGSLGAQAVGSAMQARGAKQAANTQAAYANRALDLQRQMYQEQQQRLAPYQQVGQSMLPGMQNFLQTTTPRGLSAPFPPGLSLSQFAAPPAMPQPTYQADPMQPGGRVLSSYGGR